MPDILDIQNIFFTLWGYPMSYLEFAGVVIGGVAVVLSARANIWSWPIGAVSVTLYFFLFYQIQLYPDMFLQVFFLITNIQGWWRWTHPRPGEEDRHLELRISRMPRRQVITWSAAGLLGTLMLGMFAQNLHRMLPLVFNQPSAFPYLDSFTTVMSIVATYMMIQKRVECWYVWLFIDAILTYMYFIKGVKVVSIEYGIFCLIALQGAYLWTREYNSYPGKSATS
ncbi:nicotinamide mononucleotide transporter [Fibrella sp. USSR17]